MQRFFDVVQDRSGTCIPNALVYVYTAGNTLATLYLDNGITPTVNPVTTNADGEYAFYAANGTYTLNIQATGYASDSRPGTIIFDPADGGVGIFVQAGTGAVTRTAQNKMRDIISVKDFGAVGDGVTDDRAAIVLALAAAKNSALYFPAGTYLISNSISLDSTYTNMRLFGDGASSVLKLGNNATEATIQFRQVSNIIVENLKFDGNGTNQISASARCVRIDRAATNLSFENVWFFNSYDNNVACFYTSGFGPVKTVSFTNCSFETVIAANNSNIILWNTENITFQGCYFTGWKYDAISCNFFTPAVIGGLVVDSCYFQNTVDDLFAIEFVAGDDAVPNDNVFRIKNVVISNNVFDANSKPTLGASGISGWADYVTITGNSWRRSDSGSWRQGIEAAGNYWTITGNNLDDGRIVCFASSTASSGQNYVISGNSVRIDGGSEKYGIQVGGTGTFKGLIIDGNSVALFGVTGPNSGCLNLGTYQNTSIVTDSVISNNVFTHDSVVLSVVGIRLDAMTGSKNIKISDNTIVNGDTGIQGLGYLGTDVTIQNNTFRNCATNISFTAPTPASVRVLQNSYNSSYALVSDNRGDASVTVVDGVDAPTQVFNTPLTSNRTVTLSATNAFRGSAFKVIRTAVATGASTLAVGGLKTLAAGQYAEVQHDGTSWLLTGFGAL